MNLLEQVNRAYEESYTVRFERWYKKEEVEKQLLLAAKQGYKAFKIYDSNKTYEDYKFYEVKEFESLLRERLKGFTIKKETYDITGTKFFTGDKYVNTHRRIIISWS